MQQRQPRVGDILDDYCPRERRLTDHAVVAMVDDAIRQTRCTTCDAEHEYRQGKVPPARKKTAALPPKPPAGFAAPRPMDATEAVSDAPAVIVAADDAQPAAADADARPAPMAAPEGPVHRRLIRAVLPRIEGEVPARPVPEFTMHRAGLNAKPPAHGKPQRGGFGGQHRAGGKGGHARQADGLGNRAARGQGGHGHASGRGGHAGHGSQGGHRGQSGHPGHGAHHGGQHHGRPQGRGHGNKH